MCPIKATGSWYCPLAVDFRATLEAATAADFVLKPVRPADTCYMQLSYSQGSTQ